MTWPLPGGFIRDIQYAARLIARDRWFTAAAVLALALGLGVSSTMLTVIYSMNLRPLPFQDPSRLMGVGGESTRTQGGRIPFAVFDAWRSTSTSFSGMAAHVDAVANIGDDTRATDQFPGSFVSHNAFAVLGERPMLGRDFRAEDDRADAVPVVIIGHGVWVERYGSDPATIGKTVRVDSVPSTVIGVMPEGFRFPIGSDVWRPLAAMPVTSTLTAAQRPIGIVARLADGVTIEQARAELSTIVSTLATVPEADRTRRTIIIPFNESFFGKVTDPAPLLIMTGVTLVLLMSCAHAASLLLARAAARGREMSLRASLGASRARIVRQLLIESVLMAIMAGVLGLILASAGVRWFAGEVVDFGLPYWTSFSFDGRLFTYFAVLSLGTGIVFGLVPALHLSKANLIEVLNQAGRSGGTSPRARRLTTILLVGELALTVVLLTSASVLIQSANVVSRADQTMDLADLWEFRLILPQARYGSVEQREAFYRQLDDRLAAAPGLQSAALASAAPFFGGGSRAVLMDTEQEAASQRARTTALVAIGDRYFDTLGLRLRQGTRFEDLDAASARTAALVNERFAEVFSPGVNPIGRSMRLVNERAPDAPPEWVTIVGIAPPIRQSPASGHTPVVYRPYSAEPGATASIIIRGRPDGFAETLRQVVRKIDPDLPLFGLQSLVRNSEKSRWIQRVSSTFFSILAVIATVLSALGLYAITAYSATQRTHEVGVRLALGARGSQVLWLFLRGTLFQLAIGLTLGIAGAFAAGTVLQGLLVQVRADSPVTIAAVCALLAGVAIAATLAPARKASRLDPVAALRQD